MEYSFTFREKDNGVQLILSYKDKSGKWKQKSKQGFKNKTEAKKGQDELLGKVKNDLNSEVPFEMKGMTVKEFSEIYLNDKKDILQHCSLDGMRNAFAMLKPIHEMKIEEVQYIHLSQIMNDIKKKSNSTPTTYFRRLKRFFQYAIKPYKLIRTNPLADVDPPKMNVKKRKALTLAESEKLLEKLKPRSYRYYAMSAVAIYSGLRYGEVLGLTWEDINFLDKSIRVNKQWGLYAPKQAGCKKTKTESSNRTVFVPEKLLKILREYKEKIPTHISGRIFYHITSPAYSANLNRVYRALGYDISFHTFRHSYATRLVSEGLDIPTAAAMIGDNIQTITKTYLHVTEEMRKKAKDKIENIF